MRDFAPGGQICTLARLNETHLAGLERELEQLASSRRIALIVPCHGDDLGGAALSGIFQELQGARFIAEVVVSVNSAGSNAREHAQRLAGMLQDRVRFLWNDNPEARRLLERFPGAGGKGLNIWSALGLLVSEGKADLVALQDADVTSFRSSSLARLCYPGLHPELMFEFAKMYYSRATDRLYGRITRLFLAPLLQALERVIGRQPLIEFLRGFPYPLAGEAAIRMSFAAKLPIGSGWTAELSMLSEAFHQLPASRVCQVDGGNGYDHRHRPGGAGSELVQSAAEIAGSLFAALQESGICLNQKQYSELLDAFTSQAGVAVQNSRALALLNQLMFDEADEYANVEAFSLMLQEGLPPADPVLPCWSLLLAEEPAWCSAFLTAIQVRHEKPKILASEPHGSHDVVSSPNENSTHTTGTR